MTMLRHDCMANDLVRTILPRSVRRPRGQDALAHLPPAYLNTLHPCVHLPLHPTQP